MARETRFVMPVYWMHSEKAYTLAFSYVVEPPNRIIQSNEDLMFEKRHPVRPDEYGVSRRVHTNSKPDRRFVENAWADLLNHEHSHDYVMIGSQAARFEGQCGDYVSLGTSVKEYWNSDDYCRKGAMHPTKRVWLSTIEEALQEATKTRKWTKTAVLFSQAVSAFPGLAKPDPDCEYCHRDRYLGLSDVCVSHAMTEQTVQEFNLAVWRMMKKYGMISAMRSVLMRDQRTDTGDGFGKLMAHHHSKDLVHHFTQRRPSPVWVGAYEDHTTL